MKKFSSKYSSWHVNESIKKRKKDFSNLTKVCLFSREIEILSCSKSFSSSLQWEWHLIDTFLLDNE